MKVKVIKFGGTSLSNENLSISDGFANAGNQIIEEVYAGYKVIVVLSAYSKSTDLLEKNALKISSNPDPECLDFLMSTGEQVSVALMGMYLRSKNIKCEILCGWQAGIITSPNHTKASIYDLDPTPIKSKMLDTDVMIVAGFQGISSEGKITTLGRGGSDTTAIALAIALNADSCEIRTDVAGVFTANPKYVPDAKVINQISYNEMLEMASCGATVIDSRAAELAKIYDLEFKISHNSGCGTATTASKHAPSQLSVISSSNCALIHIEQAPNTPGFSLEITKILCEERVPLGFVFQSFSSSEKSSMSLMVWQSKKEKLLPAISRFKSELNVTCDLQSNIGAISIIGIELFSKPGGAMRVTSELSKSKINILAGLSSAISVTFLVSEDSLNSATRHIHDKYITQGDWNA